LILNGYLTAGVITEFPIPTPSSTPIGITAGPDGNLWFNEFNGNNIGRISPTPKNQLTEFPVPTTNSGPVFITTGPDGNLWFTEQEGNKIGQLR
jgi:streptogramin lyase